MSQMNVLILFAFYEKVMKIFEFNFLLELTCTICYDDDAVLADFGGASS